MKKYVLNVKFGAKLDANIDTAPDVTKEEFDIFCQAIQVLISKFVENNKFRVVNRHYTEDFKEYFSHEFNNLGKVISVDYLSEKEQIYALAL